MPAILGAGITRTRFVEELPPVATARENTLYVLTTAMPNPTMHVVQDGEYVQVGGAGAGGALEAIIDLGAVASLRNPAADSVNGMHWILGDRGRIPARDPVLNPSALATNADLDSGNIPTSGGIVRWNNPMVVANRPAHDPDDTVLYYYTGSVPDRLEFSDGADYYRVSGWVQDQGGSLVFDDDVSWANVDPDQAVQFTFGNGEFANDAELLAYIIEHHGEFKRRFDAGVPRVAYYNTTGDSVRIAQITNIGRLAVEAVDEPAARSILSNIQKITGPAFDDLLAGDLTWDETPYYEPFRVLDEGVIGMSQGQLSIGRSEGGNNSAWEYERDVGNVLADDVHMVNRADIVSQFIDNRGLPHLGAAFQFVSRANVLGYLRYEQQFFAQLLREDGITKLIWANTADDGLFVADYDPTGASGNVEQRAIASLEIAASVPVPDSILNERAVDIGGFGLRSNEIRWHDPPEIADTQAIVIAASAPQFEAFYDLSEQRLRYWRADIVSFTYWTSNSVEDPLVSGVSWADISASDSDRYAAGTGRFADDDALRDFIVENYALFRTRFAAGQTRVAWFRESDETLRVSTIAKMLAQFFDNTMLTDTPEDANDWTLRGRQRDVGTAAVAGQDAAFSASALAVDADIDGGSLNAQWASPMVGTGQGFPGSTTENMAFFDTFDTQHRFRYYDADQTRLSRVLSDAELWDDDITLADVSGNNGVPGYDVAGGSSPTMPPCWPTSKPTRPYSGRGTPPAEPASPM